jgi:hypothetical protein
VCFDSIRADDEAREVIEIKIKSPIDLKAEVLKIGDNILKSLPYKTTFKNEYWDRAKQKYIISKHKIEVVGFSDNARDWFEFLIKRKWY